MSPQKQLKPSSSILKNKTSKKKKPNVDLCNFRIERDSGMNWIVGLDEVGRGPLAGPVVVAAVCFDRRIWDSQEEWISEIKDSKKLRAAKREELAEKIKLNCKWFDILEMDSEQIDHLNILRATLTGFRQLIDRANQNSFPIDLVLVDGNQTVPGIKFSQRAIVQGDQFSKSIAAASIVAKVHRDRLMHEYSHVYSGYGFEKHKGYGTQEHREAIKRLGPCEIHRQSFLKNILKKNEGAESEERALKFLTDRGFELLEKNWRSKIGEIDLIMAKGDSIHFFEVRTSKRMDVDLAYPAEKQYRFKRAVDSYLAFREMRELNIHAHLVLVSENQTQVFENVFGF